uniref:Large ribosomal subunit protein bL17m n=1 Tax=Strigamia maritima TaxID=126957 RepID=T1J5C0_STRMM
MAHNLRPSFPQFNRVISKLNFKVKHEPRSIRNIEGTYGRLRKMRSVVTALFKHERIELDSRFALEARGYADRLISEAIRHGDKHKKTMEYADFWLEEKNLIHKLFQVLAPRYESYKDISFTKVHTAPTFRSWKDDNKEYGERRKIILELRGNPYPPINIDKFPVDKQIHNVLLGEARREFYEEKLFMRERKKTEK